MLARHDAATNQRTSRLACSPNHVFDFVCY